MSPQRSPTKLSFVEEARHEQWAQLDKDIDSAFGGNEGDWYDDDFGRSATASVHVSIASGACCCDSIQSNQIQCLAERCGQCLNISLLVNRNLCFDETYRL